MDESLLIFFLLCIACTGGGVTLGSWWSNWKTALRDAKNGKPVAATKATDAPEERR